MDTSGTKQSNISTVPKLQNSNFSINNSENECSCRIFYGNERCENCNRYILKENQRNLDYNKIFSGCYWREFLTDPGNINGICKICEEILFSQETKLMEKREREKIATKRQ